MKKPKVLVISGDGINCERETARAFSLADAEPIIVHINELLKRPNLLQDVQVLAFPGGFSFSDDLGSGQIISVKIKSLLSESLKEFIAKKNPIIGICNGFQILVKLGLLPNPTKERSVAFLENTSQNFINTWVDLEVDESSICIWSKDLGKLENFTLPIRHREGRVTFLHDSEDLIHAELTRLGQVPFRYRYDINGSYQRIAGICDPSGLILGMMPHPEAAISCLQHFTSSSIKNRLAKGDGLRIFKNCVQYVRDS